MPNINKANSKAQFLDKVGSGVNVFTRVPQQMVHNHPDYYYRADTRHPSRIFEVGFVPREGGGMIYRLNEQDIDPATAISISRSFDVSALFPIKLNPALLPQAQRAHYTPPPSITFVYVVHAQAVFNTQRVQARFAAYSISNQSGHHRDKALENLYADERATPRVSHRDVVAAIHIQRFWAGADYRAGGTYTVSGYSLNRHAAAAHGVMQGDIQANYRAGTLLALLNASGNLRVSHVGGVVNSAAALAMVQKY